MRRADWYYETLNGRELTEVCSAVHAGTSGMSDRFDRPGGPEEQARDITALEHAVATWRPQMVGKWAAYDEAVRQLILTTLAEAKADGRMSVSPTPSAPTPTAEERMKPVISLEPRCPVCSHWRSEHEEGGGCSHIYDDGTECWCERTRDEIQSPAPAVPPAPGAGGEVTRGQ